jgi:outer membrane protein
MRLASLIVLTAGMLAAQGGAPRGPLQLSLKRAVELATAPEGSAKVQLSGEALDQAQARSQQARAALLPNLDAALVGENQTRNLAALGINLAIPIPGFNFPTVVGPYNTVDARVTGTQSIFDFSSIRRYQASKLGVSAAKSDVEAAQEQVAAQVARAYLAALRADTDVETARANVTLSEAVLVQSENQKAAGTGTGIEITRSRVLLANDRQRLLVAENARRATRLQLLRAMGMRLDIELELTDRLQYVPVDAVTVQQARAQALKERPDLQSQQERESNARLSASATKLERLPTVTAFGDFGSIGAGFTDTLRTRTYGFSVRLPVFDGGRREARRAESTSQYRAEKVKTNDLKEQIELDVRLALDGLNSADEQIKVAREGLELAENEMTQARRRYDAGVSGGLEVTDAQTRLARARDNQTAAVYGYNLAKLDLAQAMGSVRSTVER